MSDNNNLLEHLNHLVEVNKNSEEGFLNAAKNIKNSELETHFTDYSRQHARFAAELQREIAKLGGKPPEQGTTSGAVHRGWMDLKAALTGNSAGAILSSCESGEDSALAAYDQAEADIGTGQVFTVLQKQRQQITGFRTRLERLAGEIKDGVEFPKNE
ncbi:MAG TPA: PA2169 family four-helix-bundle protein [Bryobacteraceae bacterium]|jgi:uncharacterized protein (TIGR02284 family)|nr:PA2169 family four-helix-bundle protein [Bryobacteraceae bacterium]